MSSRENFQGKQCTAHMCEMKAEGNFDEMNQHSAQPAFVCSKCGAKADQEGCLCSPQKA